MAKVWLGVDPGVSGGLASIHRGGRACAESMPDTEKGIWKWFKTDSPVYIIAVIEKVGGYVGGHPHPGSSMFTFGVSYGGLRMALVAAGIRFEAVTPSVWQKALGVPTKTKSESKADHKNKLKKFAADLFPELKVTLATADALLLAWYARRTYG